MKDVKKFADFLKRSREGVGLTQAEVAQSLGYSTAQFVSNWERGLSHPPMKSLKVLANLYKIPSDQLFEAILELTLYTTSESLKLEYKRLFRRRA